MFQNLWAKSLNKICKELQPTTLLKMNSFASITVNHRFNWLRLRTPIFQNTYFVTTPSVVAYYTLKVINNNLKISIITTFFKDQSLPQQLSKHFSFFASGKTFNNIHLFTFICFPHVHVILKIFYNIFHKSNCLLQQRYFNYFHCT